MMTYATLAQMIAAIRGGTSGASLDQESEKQQLARMLHPVSRVDNKFTNRGWQYFAPRLATIAFRITPDLIESGINRLQLPYPLLELTSAAANGTTITPTLLPDGVASGFRTPYWALYSSTSWYNAACGTGVFSYQGLWIEITGTWGMVRNWGEALQVEDSLQAAIDAVEITITVADADGPNYYFEAPTFSQGNLIKIDDEYMSVVNTDANTLTVRRAQNGSVATTHAQDAPVIVFYPDRSLSAEFAQQAVLWWERSGKSSTTEINMVGAILTYPTDLRPALMNFLNDYVSEGI